MSKHNEEFRTEAVKLALSSDQPYSHTAKDLGINAKNLYNWIKISSSSSTQLPINYKQQLVMESIQLRKELKLVKQERDILKKAAAYFASQLK